MAWASRPEPPFCASLAERSPLNIRHFADGAARLPQDEHCVFNALEMARCLHTKMPECESGKESSMCEELTATQMQSFCRPETFSSEAEDFENGRIASPASQFPSHSFVELRNTLPSHVDIVSPFVDELMRFISRFRVADASFEIELALREALVNAIVHGNQEDPHKRVHVKSRCGADGEVSITVEDEGLGFDVDAVPDPTSPENRLQSHGRGIYLIRTLMDEVVFEQGGSVVHMHKRANATSDIARKTQ